MEAYTQLSNYIDQMYSLQEYPCLTHQVAQFSSRDLSSYKVLVCLPLVKSTLPILLPWLVSNADITVSWIQEVPVSPEILDLLSSLGCKVEQNPSEDYDLVLTSLAYHSNLRSKYGFVEFSLSGGKKFSSLIGKKVLDVSQTALKALESGLGMCDSVIRLCREGHFQLRGKKILIFGFGKIGKGIYRACEMENANVKIVGSKATHENLGMQFIDFEDVNQVKAEAQQAELVITATGVKNLIQSKYGLEPFTRENLTLVNMGPEDEFGEGMPSERVLNHKFLANYLLEEPTRLRFLDPVLALMNASGYYMIKHDLAEGVHPAPAHFVDKYLEVFAQSFQVQIDLTSLKEDSYFWLHDIENKIFRP